MSQYHPVLRLCTICGITEQELSEIDTVTSNPIGMLYQTGYLTIKSYDMVTDTYRLGYANKEVKSALFDYH